MFDIGSGELVAILVVALLLFGGRLPDVARNFGRTVGDLKRTLSETTRPLREVENEVKRGVESAGDSPGPARPDRGGAKP